ncbi:MAG: glycosyltransferase family 39 protein [Chloroflexi bacterium]|nr:glycosyltransferase family 39 protein [Chloroflexota bacterium]
MPASKLRNAVGRSIPILLILALALWLRLYGLYWDGGYLFHPDERKILLVADKVRFPWPPDPRLLLSPESPWNPRFFAYGSLPIYLLRLSADLAGRFRPTCATLNDSFVVGRVLSACFDVGTVWILYKLGQRLYGRTVGLLAAALTTVTVLHIQLAHFYAVDTILTFFVLLAIYLGVRLAQQPAVRRCLGLGLVLGMALATKVSAAPLALPATVAWALAAVPGQNGAPDEERHLLPWYRALLGLALTGVLALISFALWEPYALIDVVTFAVDVITESYMARGLADIPYTRQYIGTRAYLYPLWQMVVWSTGLPLGVTGLAGTLSALTSSVIALAQRRWLRGGIQLLPLSWVLAYFGTVGSFHAKFLRYMLPILPLLALYAAWALIELVRSRTGLIRSLGIALLLLTLGGSALYALAYTHIYRQEHTWIQTTRWLCENLPPGSSLVVEHWDDPLPLTQGVGALRCHRYHKFLTFKAYNPDDTEKLEHLLSLLEQGDYIILSSNRLYNTIPRLPRRYPLTSRYYELLMAEKLGYELVHYDAVYPQIFGLRLVNDTFSDPDLPVPRLLAEREAKLPSIHLGRADESFTVYDHPKPLVFKKTRQLFRQELLELFGDAAKGLPEPAPKGD